MSTIIIITAKSNPIDDADTCPVIVGKCPDGKCLGKYPGKCIFVNLPTKSLAKQGI